MKTTLIVIQDEADHADAKKLIEKLMGSSEPNDRARMVAQARLVEAYERSEWPRTAPTLPVLLAYIMDQHGLSRADLVPLLGTASRVSEVLSGKAGLEHDDGAPAPRALSYLSRFARFAGSIAKQNCCVAWTAH